MRDPKPDYQSHHGLADDTRSAAANLMNRDAGNEWRDPVGLASTCPWTVGRIEIRERLAHGEGQFARVELDHRDRGRVADIATGTTAFEALFRAVSRILHTEARVRSLSVRYSDGDGSARSGLCLVEVELEREGERVFAQAAGADVMRTCLEAYICGLSRDLERAEGRGRPAANRPAYIVEGMDENGDLWTFRSNDPEAAAHIADEFREDAFRWVVSV